MQTPKKWYEIYPYGTKEGIEEEAFFKALCRTKYDWRSIGAIVKETKLTRVRVEELIEKYYNKVTPPLIHPHPSLDEHWGYWDNEKVMQEIRRDERDISTKDKDNRIDKHLNGSKDVIIY